MLAARLDFTCLSVLDLYAGSGALGLEALSRGAARALFVESDHRAAEVIVRNATELGLKGATVRRGAVSAVLAGGGEPADLVFADPPYDLGNEEIGQVLTALTDRGWVHAGTVAVVERAASSPAVPWPPGFDAWRERRYGDTRLELAEFG